MASECSTTSFALIFTCSIDSFKCSKDIIFLSRLVDCISALDCKVSTWLFNSFDAPIKFSHVFIEVCSISLILLPIKLMPLINANNSPSKKPASILSLKSLAEYFSTTNKMLCIVELK